MKIVMVSIDFPPAYIGGEGIMAGLKARCLRDLGLSLEIIAPTQNNADAFDRELGVKIHRVPCRGSTFLTRMPSFSRSASAVLATLAPDLVYTLRPVIIPAGARCVYHLQTTRYGEALGCQRAGARLHAALNRAYIPLERRMIKRADQVIVLSDVMASHVQAFSPVKPEQINVIHNVLEDGVWTRPAVPKTPGQHRILYVGRLDARKGVEDLLRGAVDLLTAEKATLTIVGDGPRRYALERFVRQNKIEPHVTFLGHRSRHKLPMMYAAHDLMVVPSLYEGFGIVITEAMAMGTPVLTSDACVDLGQPRYAVGDTDKLADMLAELLGDPEKLEQLALAGLDTARTLNSSSFTRQLASVLESALDRPLAGASP